MHKAAILVLSDPASGSEEALGRVFNALAAAHDFKERGDEVTVLFQGAGTRWVRHLVELDHPAHGLYAAVADRVAGVSRGCADVFGAADDAGAVGVPLLADNAVPGTAGLASLRNLVADGYSILTF
jgi:hypothetical protein